MMSPYSHPPPGEDDRPLGRWEDATLDEIERVRLLAGGECMADLEERGAVLDLLPYAATAWQERSAA